MGETQLSLKTGRDIDVSKGKKVIGAIIAINNMIASPSTKQFKFPVVKK